MSGPCFVAAPAKVRSTVTFHTSHHMEACGFLRVHIRVQSALVPVDPQGSPRNQAERTSYWEKQGPFGSQEAE